MKKIFITPSLEVKKFNRGNIITLSGETNVSIAERKAINELGIAEKNVVKVSL